MANELKTIKIKGKDYVEVNERIKAFRKNFPNHALVTKVIHLDGEECIMEAQVISPEGTLLANGHARETRKSSNINATSYVENCETSAWGRALGNFGIGIDTAICSAQELLVAMSAQDGEKVSNAAPAATKSTESATAPTEEEDAAECEKTDDGEIVVPGVTFTDEDTKEFKTACWEAYVSEDTQTLTVVWNAYKEYKKDARFKNLVTTRNHELQKH